MRAHRYRPDTSSGPAAALAFVTRTRAGLGLVDLMVGLVISLIAMLVILKVAVLFEARRKSTVGMADAQLNAASAISLMARDIRMAGQGLGAPDSLGCKVTKNRGAAGGDLALAPVIIIDGSDGKPDQIQLLASAAPQGMSAATLIADHAAAATSLFVDSTLGIATGDWLLLYEPGKDCSLLRATTIPIGAYRIDHASPSVTLPASYVTGARVINLGTIHQVLYAVDTHQILQLARYDAGADSWHSAAMAAEVVSLQAQYGFDLRAGVQTSPQVTRWSTAMLDADGDGTTGNNGDLRRIVAIRVAIVARSAQRSDQGCHASLPQWIAGDDSTGALKTVNISLDHVPDWPCYRYRVLQTEVPLRNLLWSDA